MPISLTTIHTTVAQHKNNVYIRASVEGLVTCFITSSSWASCQVEEDTTSSFCTGCCSWAEQILHANEAINIAVSERQHP